MPKITDMQIQKNNKTRANVYVDGEFAFALEMLTVMKLGLKIGSEVSIEQLSSAVADSELSVCFERAVSYLSRGSKTCKQMRDYLLGKGYSSEVADGVICKLLSYKYLDDDCYAKAYVEQNLAVKGERRLRQELQRKGIPQDVIDRHCSLSPDVEEDSAFRLADKYMRNKPRDLKTAQKLQRYLISRGYGFDTVNAVARSFLSDDCD